MNRIDSNPEIVEERGDGQILVVGGYGDVGARVSAHLASRFPGRISIGGRRISAAETLAHRIGHGTRAVQMDINDAESVAVALDGIQTVAVCLETLGESQATADVVATAAR